MGERETEADEYPEETVEDAIERRARVEAGRPRAHAAAGRIGQLNRVCVKALTGARTLLAQRRRRVKAWPRSEAPP